MALDPVTAAFQRCQQLGWIPFFQDAATANAFPPEVLMGVGYRETNLNPKYLTVAGDNGNGYGLMQVDIHSYPDWVNAGSWKDAQSCISKGAEILASKRAGIQAAIGRTDITLTTRAGEVCTFDGVPIAGDDLLRVSVAAYNCGMWAYYHFCKGHDIDRGTTGQDYSRDVLAKAALFQQLLNQGLTGPAVTPASPGSMV